ncbi:MAG: alpha/beta hydrolase, partial [Candidatus Eremiobacteraeota bacterium]|nr:alpha/beta hydrolase [Candidatus Eremiobacteraeota bacterium]
VGSDLTLIIDSKTGEWAHYHRIYDAKVGADGNSLVGHWNVPGGSSYPLSFQRVTPGMAWNVPPPARSRLITVQSGVKVETLDWGGDGRPLVLLAGLGSTGHYLFPLARKLTGKYHVYGITRRGFGLSSTPDPKSDGNYSADRLGDDVVAVLDALKLRNPILAGHSIAGEELSSVASRYPRRIAAVIYLDAAYGYAYYSAVHPNNEVDAAELRRKLARMVSTDWPAQKRLVDDMLQTTLPEFQKSLVAYQKQLAAFPTPQPPEPPSLSDTDPVGSAIIREEQRYTHIPVPVLAIFAVPHDMSTLIPGGPAAVATAEAEDLIEMTDLVNDFANGVPQAHIVRINHADHNIFISNPAQVVREMETFIDGLAP